MVLDAIMPSESTAKLPIAADLQAIEARIAVAFAKRERLVKSWTVGSTLPRAPAKTQEELKAEDAELYQIVPPFLGLGAPVPKEYLNGDVKRKEISSNDKLRKLITGSKTGLQASKSRDLQEKARSAKRSLEAESSDEEEGRSGLGKAKKAKPDKIIHRENPILKNIQSSGADYVASTQTAAGEPKVGKKPLVDYATDDKSSTTSAKFGLGKITSAASILGSSTLGKELHNDVGALPIEKFSKSGSKSSPGLSSSDSEELETQIPQALHSNSSPASSLPSTLDSRDSALEARQRAKKEKNRLKKVKRKERKMATLAETG